MANSRPKLGLRDVYVAPLVSDPAGGTPSWGTPVKLNGSVKADFKKNGNIITDWGDDSSLYVMNTRGNVQATFEFIDCDPDVLAAMLGQTRANGITLGDILDQSPDYAIGFRVWMGGTNYAYYWFYKGKFSIPDENQASFKGTAAPGHTTLTAEFSRLLSISKIEAFGRTDYNLSSTLAAAWFNAPVISTGVNVSAVLVAIAKATTNTTFTFTKQDSSVFSMAESSAVVGVGILVIVAGAVKTGTLAWAGEGTASVVATFTPTVAYGTATVLASCTADVRDANGVPVTPNTVSLSYP